MARPLESHRVIARDLQAAADRKFDLIVIGGGIQGAALAQQAARRGASVVLCEAGDFGAGTSWNSLRILHGGLRYLQKMDLRRFFHSVHARRGWALRFPQLVRPLPCLMPLYGQGLKRPAVMRVALAANDMLSAHYNTGLDSRVSISRSRVLDVRETVKQFASVRREGLQGAALWHDYFMRSSERILIELLRDACRHGAIALNYTAVEGVQLQGGRVCGVHTRDAFGGERFSIRAGLVANCAGPRIDQLIPDRQTLREPLFRPSLAFNLLLNQRLPSECAVGVSAPHPAAPILFMVPQQGTTLAGTMHLPCPIGTVAAEPTAEDIEGYLAQIRAALPQWPVQMPDVRCVFAGLLPAAKESTVELCKRELVTDHGAHGGAAGFYSLCGVKFTTADTVARIALNMMGFPGSPREHVADEIEPLTLATSTPWLTTRPTLGDVTVHAQLRQALLQTVREESVQTFPDLIRRRTNWATTEPDLDALSQNVLEMVPELQALPNTVALVTHRDPAGESLRSCR